MAEYRHYVLDRDSGVSLSFRGHLLGRGESRGGVTAHIYRTEFGQYVVKTQRGNAVRAHVYATAEEMLAGCRKVDGRIPRAELEGLRQAARADKVIAAAMVEEVA